MTLPFLKNDRKRPDQLVAVDLGGRTTKAVQLQRKGSGFVLSAYALLDAPIYDKTISADLLSEHLKAVCQTLGAKSRSMTVALSVNDSVVRHAEMPVMPVGEMRQILKNNPKPYLQQDLQGYVFDCFITVPKSEPKAEDRSRTGVTPKQRVLVAGARKQLIDDVETAMRSTGLAAESVVPGLITPVNAFEMAMPEVFAKEAVALIDIGFRSTSISLLKEGELVLSRVVNIGGDRLTSGLAEAMGISYAEAEGIKVGIPAEVQMHLEPLIIPLGRELRASIDCFEHQQDKPVAHVFISGGSARSPFIVQALQAELTIECKTWNPLSFLQFALPPEPTAELDQAAPQLTVAVGAALAAF